jgi:hypothetical protein
MQIEKVAGGQETKDPVVTLDVSKHCLDRVTNETKNGPHNVHLISPALKQAAEIYHDRPSPV